MENTRRRGGRRPGLKLNGPVVREIRLELGLGSSEVAEQARLSRQHYVNAESGTSSVSAQALSRIARVLKVKADQITVNRAVDAA